MAKRIGKTRRSAHTIGRNGWNERGPTIALQFEQAVEQSNPNNYQYEREALKNRDDLFAIMGKKQFTEWVETVWPGKTIDNYTWKQIGETYAAKLEEILLAANPGADPNNQPQHYKTHGS